MATTEKLDLPLIEPNMTADVPRDMNALAEAVDAKAGVAGGLAVLGPDGKVPADQLNVKDPVDASLTQKGIVQLSEATNSTSNTMAATPKAVKAAYDLANNAYRDRGNAPLNCNDAILSGNYNVALSSWTGYSNYPANAYTYGKLVVDYNGGACVQTYYTHDNPGRIFTRISFNGADWRAWTELLKSNGGIVTGGTVFDLGSGSNIIKPTKNWALQVYNKTDNGNEGGLVVGNRYESSDSTVFLVGTLNNGGTANPFKEFFKVEGGGEVKFRDADGTMVSLRDLKQSVVDGKGVIAGAINGKGGNVTASNTFAEYAAAITNLPVKRFANGTFNGQSAQATSTVNGIDMNVSVNGLPFVVRRIFIRVILSDTANSREIDAIVMTSNVFADNVGAKGWRNNSVGIGYLEPPIQGFNVKLSGSKIDAYAGGSPIAKISAYEWWAYE